jgi:hypothetical protein
MSEPALPARTPDPATAEPARPPAAAIAEPARRPARHHWTWRREIVDLAVLFLAVGASGLFTEFLGQRHHGWITLMCFGVLLGAASGLHWWWKAHGPGRLRSVPIAAPAAQPRPDAASSGWADAEQLNLWRIRAVVRDTPGSLAAVCERLAHLGVNILGLQVHPLGEGVLDEFLVDVPTEVTPDLLAEAVSGGGAVDARIDRADTQDLTDAPARMLTLAARLTAGTASLAVVLHDLFGGCTVGWLPDEVGESAYQDTQMTLADPDGGSLRIAREELAFTPTEFARAQALVALCFELRRVRQAG